MVVGELASKYRVLVIEEEALLRLLLEDMIYELGHEVVACGGTLQEAMQLTGDAEFDVAVLDMRIDGILTFPVADILVRRNLPYVFATAIMPTNVPAQHWGRPVLAKPFEHDEVRRVLDQSLAQSSRRPPV
jgi:CheY-like chemotaxis protein